MQITRHQLRVERSDYLNEKVGGNYLKCEQGFTISLVRDTKNWK